MLSFFRCVLVVAGALGISVAAAEDARAERRDAFTIGSIWSGGAWFESDGTFSNCSLFADFPEGWPLGFYLYPNRILEIEFDEPDIGIAIDPDLTLQVDGRNLANIELWVDEDALDWEDWLLIYGDLGRIEDLAPALKSGGTLTAILNGDGTWTGSAALTDSDRAFSALEDCLARNGGAAPTRSANGSSSASTAYDEPEPTYYGAIAIGEDDDGLLSAITTGYLSYDEAGAAAVESCEQDYDDTCSAEMYLDDEWPCGAVAGGNDGDGLATYGYSRAGSLEQAKVGALEACSEAAYDCTVGLSACVND